MSHYSYDDEKTQAVGSSAGHHQEMPTEVVGSQRAGPSRPYGSDVTIVRSTQDRDPSFAWLVVMNGPRAGDILRLKKGDTVLGREADNDIMLDDEFCSRRHAKVKLEADADDEEDEPAFFIYDLATPNGTLVNGAEILRAKLTDGDRVQIGETVMVFKQV